VKKRPPGTDKTVGSLWTTDEYGKYTLLGEVDKVDMSDLQEFRDKYWAGVDTVKPYDYETAQQATDRQERWTRLSAPFPAGTRIRLLSPEEATGRVQFKNPDAFFTKVRPIEDLFEEFEGLMQEHERIMSHFR